MNTHTLRDIKAVQRPAPSFRDQVETSATSPLRPEEQDLAIDAHQDAPLAAVQPSLLFEKAPVFLMLLLVFLLPLFVIPSPTANFNISKMLFATLTIGAAFG